MLLDFTKLAPMPTKIQHTDYPDFIRCFLYIQNYFLCQSVIPAVICKISSPSAECSLTEDIRVLMKLITTHSSLHSLTEIIWLITSTCRFPNTRSVKTTNCQQTVWQLKVPIDFHLISKEAQVFFQMTERNNDQMLPSVGTTAVQKTHLSDHHLDRLFLHALCCHLFLCPSGSPLLSPCR